MKLLERAMELIAQGMNEEDALKKASADLKDEIDNEVWTLLRAVQLLRTSRDVNKKKRGRKKKAPQSDEKLVLEITEPKKIEPKNEKMKTLVWTPQSIRAVGLGSPEQSTKEYNNK